MHEVKFDWDEVLPYRSLLAPQTHKTDGFHGNHDSKLKDQRPRTSPGRLRPRSWRGVEDCDFLTKDLFQWIVTP